VGSATTRPDTTSVVTTSSEPETCAARGDCAIGAACDEDEECASNTCHDTECVDSPASCGDMRLNGNETGTDCGGADCTRCAAGSACSEDDDCLTNQCGSAGVCTLAGRGDGCDADADCMSGYCSNGTCAAGFVGAGCEMPNDCQSLSCANDVC